MIYYILLGVFFLSSIFDLNVKNERGIILLKKYIYFVSIIILVFFAGLRFDTGWDYKGYHYYYDSMPTLNALPSNLGVFREIYFEPGFKLLMSLSKTLGADYYGFQFIISSLCVFMIHRAIKKENAKLLIIFMYFSTCYLFLNMSVLRQGIAVALLYLSLSVLYEGKKSKAIFYILLGCSFHSSLLLFLPMVYISDKRNISNRLLYLLVAVAVFVYFLQMHWLKPIFNILSPIFPHDLGYKINNYLDSERFGRSREIGLGVIEKIVTFITLLYVYSKDSSRKNMVLLRFFIFYMITYFAFYEVTVLYDRLRLYFVAVNVFVYLTIFNFFSGYNKVVIFFIVILYSSFSYFNIFRSESNASVFIPYHNVLESENSIPAKFKGDLRIDRAIEMDH